MGLRVGLTGSMGSGKTTVASIFKNLGAVVLDADQICRDLVLPTKPAWQEVIDAFGTGILNEDQSIDRKKLAHIVFNDDAQKKQLENILHPKVISEEMRLSREIFQKDPQSIIIIEAALLIESGNYRQMDKVIVVTCDEEKLIRRAMARSSMTLEEAQKRVQSQMSQEEKSQRADYILKNDGSMEDLTKKVQELFNELKTLI